MLRRSIRALRKLHRQIGIFLAIFLILLSVTGVAINHSQQFKLSDRYVPGWIASFYLDDESTKGLAQGDQVYYAIGGTLFANREAIAPCAEFSGKANFDGQEIALCSGELILFTPELLLIERIDAAKGLPLNVDAIHSTGEQLLVRTTDGWFGFDLLSLLATPAQPPIERDLEWVSVSDELLLREAVSWQQFLLDVHSGAILGLSGKLFMDLVALFIILMAVSGVVMWRNARF